MAWQDDDFDDGFEEGFESARKGDSQTSIDAGREMDRSGQKLRDQAAALALVCRLPGRTARELDASNGTPEGTVRKRLAELERLGRVNRGMPRVSVIGGKQVGKLATTWWPVNGGKQQQGLF
jgi:hypothetical protein